MGAHRDSLEALRSRAEALEAKLGERGAELELAREEIAVIREVLSRRDARKAERERDVAALRARFGEEAPIVPIRTRTLRPRSKKALAWTAAIASAGFVVSFCLLGSKFPFANIALFWLLVLGVGLLGVVLDRSAFLRFTPEGLEFPGMIKAPHARQATFVLIKVSWQDIGAVRVERGWLGARVAIDVREPRQAYEFHGRLLGSARELAELILEQRSVALEARRAWLSAG